MKQFYNAAFIVFVVVFCENIVAEELKKLTFSTLDGTYVQEISEEVLRAAYKRLGIEIEVKELPARRAIVLANTGGVDGELSRIAGIEKKFTSLLPVRVPINFIEGVVLSKDKPVKVNGWDSIRHMKVAIRRGVVFTEKGTIGMDVQVLNSWQSALAALQTGRADVVVIPRTLAANILLHYEPRNIFVNEPPIISMPLFHYLHKKRSSLVPLLERVLNEMQAEGEIERIISERRKSMATEQVSE